MVLRLSSSVCDWAALPFLDSPRINLPVLAAAQQNSLATSVPAFSSIIPLSFFAPRWHNVKKYTSAVEHICTLMSREA